MVRARARTRATAKARATARATATATAGARTRVKVKSWPTKSFMCKWSESLLVNLVRIRVRVKAGVRVWLGFG